MAFYEPASRYLQLAMPASVLVGRGIGELKGEDWVYQAVSDHEVLHHLQSLATTHGLTQMLFAMLEEDIVHAAMTTTRAKGTRPKLPLLKCRNESSARQIGLGRSLHEFNAALMGETNPRPDALGKVHSKLLEGLRHFAADVKLPQGYDWLQYLSFDERDVTVNPRATRRKPAGTIDDVGLSAVAESWSHNAELLLLRSSFDFPEFEDLYYERSFGPYSVVWGLLQTHLLPPPDFYSFIVTAASLCEFAMTPPSPTSARPCTWRDWAPGPRLWKAVGAMLDSAIPWIDLDDLVRDQKRFVQHVAEEAGWERPNFTLRDAAMEAERLAGRDQTKRIHAHAGLLHFRSKQPVSTVMYPLVGWYEGGSLIQWRKVPMANLLIAYDDQLIQYREPGLVAPENPILLHLRSRLTAQILFEGVRGTFGRFLKSALPSLQGPPSSTTLEGQVLEPFAFSYADLSSH